ncbi:A-kinase anchor protein 4 [Lemmus lemmus]
MHGTGLECRDGGRKTILYSELSNKNKCGEKQMCSKDSKEFADSISKGLMVYANQVAPDMMVSVMKTLKVHSCEKPIPACVVLKRVLLKHTKKIVSDLIDSCMKNLHNITGDLMTDSDFVSAVKRNLFNHGKQNAADIMEAMLKNLVSALLGEKKETKSQSLAYATFKAGTHDPKCKNQSLEFSAMKGEMKGKHECKVKTDLFCKSLTSAEKICFVDVSTLNVEDKDSKGAAGSSSEGKLTLENLEEKEIVVIKDTEKQDQSKMEGSVCLFKQAPSNHISVLNWLLNDLYKYALVFQHALSPSASSCKHKVGDLEGEYHKIPSENCYSVYADQLSMGFMDKDPQNLCLEMGASKNTNNNQTPSNPAAKSPNNQRSVATPDGECSMDDLSFYVNQLASLVIQMARKEIKDKLEGGSKCIHRSIYAPTGEKGKAKPQRAVSKIASEMAHEAVELTSAEMHGTGEECRDGGRKTFLYSELSNKNKCGEKQMCP